MLDRGVRLIGRGIWYISAAHTEQDIDHAIDVAKEVLIAMKHDESVSAGATAI